MKEQTRLWIDPPEGWRYGFPKLYEPMKDGNLDDWLVREGYPRSQIHLALYVRAWDADDA